ncbi:hypothetical protein [Thalassococcus lentus]|uniref:Uncharacterized protein n=1 Tax=Thalassococcus lentus TaxID=1210524 RepID=A0ABT4XUH0_9RHOB|nr:hypothetical protein [Thalassococcus lentus]MDA7425604.1 hypothetical protein [Thalassococcus lentus]
MYWEVCEDFVNLAKQILDEEDASVFQESAPVSASCLSKVAAEKKSTELLHHLISCAQKSFQDGFAIRGEAIVSAALKAATGQKWIKKSELTPFLNVNMLDTIQFDMELET